MYPGQKRGPPERSSDIERSTTESSADPAHSVQGHCVDGVQAGGNRREYAPDRGAHAEDSGRRRILKRTSSRLTPGSAPRPPLFPPFNRLLALALTLQPPRVPFSVRLDRCGLNFQPTLVVAEILLRRNQNLA
ncbi:MAG: hypothetical protein H7X78_07390 [Methyloceanibacter sp.]|nr:hypothetical protein [Methyloceanibacter sp.]